MKTSAASVASRFFLVFCFFCIQVDPLSMIVETIFSFSDPRHKLCDELHLPSAEEQVGGGQDRGVRPLRMSRMFRITSLVSKIIHYC